MKKFIISSIAAMVVFAGAYASAATAEDMGTMTIKAGVPASYIMGLQKNLNVCANATPALVADGKYGAKTTAAVKAFQMSTPGLTVDGKAGNMTKAALAAKCSGSTTTTTTSGALCPNGMTLASNCMTAPVASTLNGGAGNVQSFTLLGSPSNIQVGEGNSNVQVMGFEVRADAGSDLKLTNVRLSFENKSGTGSTWISRYVSSIGVYQGSTLVGTANVADLSQDGTAYTGTIALNNVVVKANSTTQLYVTVTANSSIDGLADVNAQWTITANSLRYQDASGAILTTNSSVSQTMRFLKLSTSAAVKLKLTEDNNNPKDRTVVANYTSTTNDQTLLKFSMKAEGSDMNIRKIALPATAVGVADAAKIASYYKLKYNGTVISSFSLNNAAVGYTATATPTITFGDASITTAGYTSTSLNGGLGRITIAKDSTASFEVVADINAMSTGTGSGTNFDAGDTLKVDFPFATLQGVTVEDQTGNTLGTSATNRSGSVTGYAATFRIQGLSTAKSAESINETINNSGVITQARYTMDLAVSATGSDFFVPETATYQATGTVAATYTTGIAYGIVDSTGAYVNLGSNVSASVSPISSYSYSNGRAKVADGSTQSVRLSVSVADTTVPAGQYRVVVLAVNGDPVDTTTNLPSFATTPTTNFRTAYNPTAFQ